MEMIIQVFFIGFTAALLSSISGGGSALVATPLLIMLGYPLQLVIASNNLSGACWTPFAARNYLKTLKIDYTLVSSLVILGVVGSWLGATVVTGFDEALLKIIVGTIIFCLSILVYFKKDFGLEEKKATLSKTLCSLFALPLGFYEGFLGSGNGLFTSAVLTRFQGFSLIRALGTYYIIAFFWCSIAAATYIYKGFWDTNLMLPAASGSILGASLGSKLGKKYGSPYVRKCFVAVGSILGLELLLNGFQSM